MVSCISAAENSVDHGLAFFFHNYVINNHKYHPSLSRPDNEHLLTSIKAFSIAGLSKHYADKALVHSARQHYVGALKLTNSALRDPQLVTRDETLLSILVLTNYETLTGGVNRSLEAWEQHINGASSLLSLRGIEGIKHEDGRILTMHVISLINITCLLKCLPTPVFVHQLQTKIFEYLFEPNSPMMRYQRINLKCADFRHAASNHQFESIEAIFARAAELDAELLAAFTDLPGSYQCEVIESSDAQHTEESGLPNYEIRYSDHATSYIWTSFRSSRILVQEILLETLRLLEKKGIDTTRFSELRHHAFSITRECQTQILATMPQFLGFAPGIGIPEIIRRVGGLASSVHEKTQLSMWSQFPKPGTLHATEALRGNLPIMRALGGYGILWPLFAAATCETRTPEIREYVKALYSHFGLRMKIEQAMVLREMF